MKYSLHRYILGELTHTLTSYQHCGGNETLDGVFIYVALGFALLNIAIFVAQIYLSS